MPVADIELTRSTPYELYPQNLRVPEAAIVLDVTAWTVYQLVHQGKIPYRRVGKTILIPKEFFGPENARLQVTP